MEKYKIPFNIEVYNRDVRHNKVAKLVTRGGKVKKISTILDEDYDYPVIIKGSKQHMYYDRNGRYSISGADHIEDLFIEYEDIPKGTPVVFKYGISSFLGVGHYHADGIVSILGIPDYIMTVGEIIPVNEFDFINLCKLK